jgi:hypothetical protein
MTSFTLTLLLSASWRNLGAPACGLLLPAKSRLVSQALYHGGLPRRRSATRTPSARCRRPWGEPVCQPRAPVGPVLMPGGRDPAAGLQNAFNSVSLRASCRLWPRGRSDFSSLLPGFISSTVSSSPGVCPLIPLPSPHRQGSARVMPAAPTFSLWPCRAHWSASCRCFPMLPGCICR